MRILVSISRILVGALFIFSGLVKAIDPLGLAYKMSEFFEAWANSGFMKGMMHTLDQYVLAFSIIMITLEVALGVALLLGWQKKITAWLLLLLTLFFTFLTSYVLFSGKIRACGCFGDCIPLTPVQTFTKDIVLLILVIILIIGIKHIRPVAKPWINSLYLLAAVLLTLFLQWYVLKYLPVVDCLPYKKGNDILRLREMPANAIPDKYDYVFVYEKNGESKEFTTNALPDSSWTFKERKQTLIQKGSNNIPLINDFSISTIDGADSTAAILSTPGTYHLLFIKEPLKNTGEWIADLKSFASNRKTRLYVLTSARTAVEKLLSENQIPVDGVFTTDMTAIKTAARANPVIFEMNGPVVQKKWSWANFDDLK